MIGMSSGNVNRSVLCWERYQDLSQLGAKHVSVCAEIMTSKPVMHTVNNWGQDLSWMQWTPLAVHFVTAALKKTKMNVSMT